MRSVEPAGGQRQFKGAVAPFTAAVEFAAAGQGGVQGGEFGAAALPVNRAGQRGERQALAVEGAGLVVGQAEAADNAVALRCDVGGDAEFGLRRAGLPGGRVDVFKQEAGAGESGVGEGRESDLGRAGDALGGDGGQRDAFERAVGGQRQGERALVELAGNLGAGGERQGGEAVEAGAAGDGDAASQGMDVCKLVLAAVAAEAGGEVGGGEAVADTQFQNCQFFRVDRERQLQIDRRRCRRVARGGDDVQGGDAQFGDVQCAAEQG